MMGRLVAIAVMGGLLALAGCTSVRTTHSATANLSRYQTFAFSPNNEDPELGPAAASVRDTIARDLQLKGYRAVSDNPDFLVEYGTRTHERLQATQSIRYGWVNAWPGPGLSQVEYYPYTVGTLVIDFVDPHTRQVFWRGTASNGVENPDNLRPEKLESAARQVIKKFPSATASAAAPTRM